MNLLNSDFLKVKSIIFNILSNIELDKYKSTSNQPTNIR